MAREIKVWSEVNEGLWSFGQVIDVPVDVAAVTDVFRMRQETR